MSPVQHEPGIARSAGRYGTALAATAGAALLAACASAGAPGGAPGSDVATETEWQALAEPRPAPLAGAPRVSFAGIELADAVPWSLPAVVPLELGLSELVAAGLLRRRDVELVERRRFAAAVEAEREGRSRPPGAPAAGVSRGVELTASAVWLPLPGGRAALEVRLSRTETGAVEGASRIAVPADADLVASARAIVATILAALDEMDRLPAWDDPSTGAAPATYRASGVPPGAIESFLRGLAAEEQWNWEGARRSYQAAASTDGGFPEAQAALARTARLRIGGTLGES